ncbi:MAG TPA: electron transfer flavoprotein subunit beta/FixA family protein [Bacillota bacterium]
MNPLNVILFVKPVPDPRKSRGSAVIDPEKKTVRRQGVPLVANPADRYALDTVVRLKGRGVGRVVTVGMGPPDAEGVLRETLALGADVAYLLSDRAMAGSDALATARALAAAARKVGFDLILTGAESSDAGTGQVGPTLAGLLGLPHVLHCDDLTLALASQGADGDGGPAGDAEGRPLRVGFRLGGERGEAALGLPALLTFDRLDRPLKPAGFAGVVAARSKPCSVWGLADLGLPAEQVGPAGSPTVVREVRPAALQNRATILDGGPEAVADKVLSILAEKGVI